MEKSISSLVEVPANLSASQATELDLTEHRDSCGSMYDAFEKSVLDGLSGKTCQERYRHRKGRTSDACSKSWMNSGTVWHGEYSTRSSSEYHSGAVVCSLSEVLETDVPPTYSLSPTACAGILRRAATRGRALPKELKEALESVVRQCL